MEACNVNCKRINEKILHQGMALIMQDVWNQLCLSIGTIGTQKGLLRWTMECIVAKKNAQVPTGKWNICLCKVVRKWIYM